MKVFIINYNRLTLPVNLANWCYSNGLDPVFIDNGSDYPLLLQYYAHVCPYPVHRMGANFGHKVMWCEALHILEVEAGNERYIVTDPDLDLSGVPADFLEVMSKGLDKYPTYDKCGLSLEINDLPNSEEGNFIRYQCEARYWKTPLDNMFFKADTDTTFALYREGVKDYNHNAIRTNRPYTAKHVPWYYLNYGSLSDEEKYYFSSANDSSSGKQRLMK